MVLQNTWDISKHGDWLETTASSFIKERLPAYEEIWKRYIGHNGKGVMAEMANCSGNLDVQRKNFAQHHYTILESLYLMDGINAFEQLRVIDSFDKYKQVLNNLMAYQAHAGRVRDNILSCLRTLDKKDQMDPTSDKLDKFYQERHVFVHGKKLPFFIDQDSLFNISKVRDKNVSDGGVGKGFLWEDITEEDMVAADEYLEDSVKQLTLIINGILESMLETVKAIIKENNLQIANPPSLPIMQASGDVNIFQHTSSSATTVTNIISGVK